MISESMATSMVTFYSNFQVGSVKLLEQLGCGLAQTIRAFEFWRGCCGVTVNAIGKEYELEDSNFPYLLGRPTTHYRSTALVRHSKPPSIGCRRTTPAGACQWYMNGSVNLK